MNNRPASPTARKNDNQNAEFKYCRSVPRGFWMIASRTPMSVSVCRRVLADRRIAMVPKALGARSRATIMFLPNRTACSATLAVPSEAPPRKTLARRLPPTNMDCISRLSLAEISRIAFTECHPRVFQIPKSGYFLAQNPPDYFVRSCFSRLPI